MPCGTGFMRGLIGQLDEILTELGTERQKTSCPGIQNSGRHGLARSPDGPLENHATDDGLNGAVRVLLDAQGGGLGDEVAGGGVKISSHEQRLEDIVIQRRAYHLAERQWCEVQEMPGVTQSVFQAAKIAARDHLDATKPEIRRERINIFSHGIPPRGVRGVKPPLRRLVSAVFALFNEVNEAFSFGSPFPDGRRRITCLGVRSQCPLLGRPGAYAAERERAAIGSQRAATRQRTTETGVKRTLLSALAAQACRVRGRG